MPVELPFSILDYGLTALALILMGGIVYVFVRFLTNHMTGVTTTLEHLVETSRDLRDESHGMADEFHRLTSEVRELSRALHDHDRG